MISLHINTNLSGAIFTVNDILINIIMLTTIDQRNYNNVFEIIIIIKKMVLFIKPILSMSPTTLNYVGRHIVFFLAVCMDGWIYIYVTKFVCASFSLTIGQIFH